MHVDLSDKTAIVTGAGRGIGREIAHEFAAAGADIVAAARTTSEIEAVADAIESAYDVRAVAVPTDLSSEADAEALVTATTEAFGTPDILINNAGANIVKPPLELSVEEIDTMLDVNVRGLFLLSRAFGRELRNSETDSGRIINISSLTAHLGVPAMAMYSGTKSGVIGMTRGLAAAFAGDGVTVNSVSPGLTRIDRTEAVIEEKAGEVFELDRIPVGRIGEPEDTAAACLYLASDDASYVTGIDLPVDGGVCFTAGLYR
jgi:NAD(P)-dependent dehydrogenase (short-subunit alcohol dehydrogenase family)